MKYYSRTFLFLFVAASGAFAIELPAVFSDHMVLQRDRPVPVWGRGAAPGAGVVVEFGGQTLKTQAEGDGSWLVRLEPLTASTTGQKLIVRSADVTREFSDVLVGEVWLCSGQSNMEWSVARSQDPDLEAATANRPLLRLFQVDKVTGPEERWTSAGKWQACSPATVGGFSAVGYRFGATLQEALGVPVGLIQAAWGGTPAIAWTRLSAMGRHPQLEERTKEWDREMALFPEKKAAWEKEMAAFRKSNGIADDAKIDPKKYPDAPKAPIHDPKNAHRPGTLAAGMISPIAPFAMRGVIWYQGETDAGWSPADYDERLAVMFSDWRDWFGNPELQIGIVQLANYMAPAPGPTDNPWPHLRESQRQFVLADGKSGLVSAIDAGEANDIHPADKGTIGRRLARWALTDIYGLLKLKGGPVPQEARRSGTSVVITFEDAGQGLRAFNGEPLGGFTMAGRDGIFQKAEARIENNTVILSSEAVPTPERVRYAWQNNPVDANLVNIERLPAPAFEIPVSGEEAANPVNPPDSSSAQ